MICTHFSLTLLMQEYVRDNGKYTLKNTDTTKKHPQKGVGRYRDRKTYAE